MVFFSGSDCYFIIYYLKVCSYKNRWAFLWFFFLHEISSSFEKQFPYQKRYHDLLDQKSVSFIFCIKACKNLNGTTWFFEMDWKKFGKDRKPFATFLEIWQKIPAEEQNF